MFKPDPRPNPADVGCRVYKQCAEKCDKCKACKAFNALLPELAPNDVQSKHQRTTWEWKQS